MLLLHRDISALERLCALAPTVRVVVMFGFRRNPDVAGNGRSGGRKCVWPIAIDYCTVAGTAGAGCKETKDRRGQTVGVQNGLRRPFGDTRARRLRDETKRAEIDRRKQKIAVILVLRNTSTGCRLLNTTEAEQGRWG